MSLFRVLFAMLTAALAAIPAAARELPEPTDAQIAGFMDTFLKREMARRGIPGGALVVVRDGRAIHSAGYGFADLGTRAAIDPERSLFRQGSISKLFAWTLAMQLVEQGRLDPDRDVNDYLEFDVPAPVGRPVTMRHLLTHTAGFSDRLPLVREGDYRLPYGQRLKENMPEIVYVPGSTLAYSNYGAALAAHVVERVAKRPFEQLVEERIFAPAGMTGSTFAQPIPSGLRVRLVSNYSASARQPSRFEYIGFAPAGSLSATPADMGRFVAALLSGGNGVGGGLLSESTAAAMTSLQRPLVPGLRSGLGFGFIVGEYRGVRYAGHGGSMMAATTDLELLPKQGLGWTLSFNGRGVNGAAIPLRQDLLRAVIDRFYAAAASPVARGPSSATEVAGAYVPALRMHSGPLQLASINPLKVRATTSGELRIELEEGETRWLPVGHDRFVEAESRLPLAVSRGADGRIFQLASPLLNSVSAYEPARLHLRLALPLLLIAPPLLVIGGLAMLAVVVARRLVCRRRPIPSGAAADGWLWRLFGPSLALVIATMLAWLGYLTVAIVFPGAADQVDWMLAPLHLLGLATCVAAAVLLAGAAQGWRGSGHPAAKLGATLVASAAASFAWLLTAFGLASVPLA